MKDRIALWRHAFEQDERSVRSQLVNLSTRISDFNCIVEAVRLAPEGESGGKKLNRMLFQLLARGFWESTILAIRRLADASQPLRGERGVCSLGAILEDVYATRAKFTRRVFVEEVAGLTYNYANRTDQHWRLRRPIAPDAADWVPVLVTRDESEDRHRLFDWLSGTTPGTSRPDDVIREEIFERLRQRLAKLDQIAEHASVNHAHAANQFSRAERGLSHFRLDDAKQALKHLVELSELIGRWFCYSGVGLLPPRPQFDLFEDLDQPLLCGSPQPLLDAWEAFAAETVHWIKITDSDV